MLTPGSHSDVFTAWIAFTQQVADFDVKASLSNKS